MDDSTTPTPPAPAARKALVPIWVYNVVIALALIGAVLIVGAGLYGEYKTNEIVVRSTQVEVDRRNEDCGKEKVKAAAGKIGDISIIWTDAYKVASATGRGNLYAPVASLQAIRRDLMSLEVPRCMNVVKEDALSSMNSAIDGFFAFMKEEPESTVNTYFRNAGRFIDASSESMKRIMACAPDCP
jgi:hypothetical protein